MSSNDIRQNQLLHINGPIRLIKIKKCHQNDFKGQPHIFILEIDSAEKKSLYLDYTK